MNRRTALTLLGSGLATGLAGCTGPLPRASQSPSPARRLDPGQSAHGVTVENFAHRVSIATPDVNSPVHVDVAAVEGKQFLVCDATGVDVDVAESMDVTLDGQPVDAYAHRVGDVDWARLGFDVPIQSADTASVVWRRDGGGVRWRVPDGVVDGLGDRPAFEVTTYDAPASVEAGDAIEVDLAVANEGGRDGRFLAELGTTDLSDTGEVHFDVPAGETVRKRLSVEPPLATPAEGAAAFQVVLDWGTGRLVEEVRVDRETTPTDAGSPTPTGTPDGPPTVTDDGSSDHADGTATSPTPTPPPEETPTRTPRQR